MSAPRVWGAVMAGVALGALGLWFLALSLEGYSFLPDISGPSEAEGGWRLFVGIVLILAAPFSMAAIAGPAGSWRRGVFGLLAGVAALTAGLLVDADSAIGLAGLVFAAMAVASVFPHRPAWPAAAVAVVATVAVLAFVGGKVERWVGPLAVVVSVTAGLVVSSRASET